MGNRVFGGQGEHPQVLVWGFEPAEFQAIEGLLPGARRIFFLDDVHQAEWDLLIARGRDLSEVEPHLFILAFSGGLIGPVATVGRPTDVQPLVVRDLQDDPPKGRSRLRSVATRFEAPGTAPAAFADLISDDLVPLLQAEGEHSILLGYTRTGDVISEPSLEIPGVEPLIKGSDGAIYAAHFRRQGGDAWCLTLPAGASLGWIAAGVNHWHTIDRRRFPGTLDWVSRAIKWLTPDELAAAQRWIEGMEAVDAAKATESALHTEFLETRAVAAAGPFRLLTAGDRPLEEAVAAAFTDLGFVVREMDSEQPADDRLEDLRVSPPENPDWVALVEIKGYARSLGRAADLLNLTGRFGRRFREAEKRDPDAYWYVVNHEIGADPDARKMILEGSEAELRAFAGAGGLAIDTRDLYRLWRAVAHGNLPAADARALLVSATGRFAWEPVEPEPAHPA